MSILAAIFGFVRAILWRQATLALENLALRQQVTVRERSMPVGNGAPGRVRSRRRCSRWSIG